MLTLNHQIALTITKRVVVCRQQQKQLNGTTKYETFFPRLAASQGFKGLLRIRYPDILKSYSTTITPETQLTRKTVINSTIRQTNILVIHCSQKYLTTPMLVVLYSCSLHKTHRRSY